MTTLAGQLGPFQFPGVDAVAVVPAGAPKTATVTVYEDSSMVNTDLNPLRSRPGTNTPGSTGRNQFGVFSAWVAAGAYDLYDVASGAWLASTIVAANPAGSSTGGGGVESVVAGTGIAVDDTDPANPIVSQSGTSVLSLPAADQSGPPVIDTTTYDNPVHPASGKMATLVFPASDTAMLAVAQQGDAFPRFLFTTDPGDGLYFGDGTVDPYGNGGNIFVGSGGTMAIATPLGAVRIGAGDGTIAHLVSSPWPVKVQNNATIHSGTVDPNGAEAGHVDDLYIRTGAPGFWMYRCTVAGVAGIAQWVTAAAGTPVVRAFNFSFDNPDLVTGAALYTPTVGDLILDASIRVTGAFDGTTPKGDFGTFVGGNDGLLTTYGLGVIDMTAVDVDATSNAGLGVGPGGNGDLASAAAQSVNRILPLYVSAANPIKVCVSTTGKTNGADPVASQGVGTVFLTTVTPAF